jgi:glycyl-tRNA synthetase
MFLSILSASYKNETLEDGTTRIVLTIPPALAPFKVAILPLIKKDGLPEKAREIVSELQYDFAVQYDEKDSIGKRYRRQDAIGTPYAITIDHQSLEDKTVTIRDRDTMKQERIQLSEIHSFLLAKTGWKELLGKLK